MELSKLYICADDYAQSPAISEGILRLAREGRINAISCLSNSPDWPQHAKPLQTLSDVHCGLHFNLTWGEPLSTAWRQQYGTVFFALSELISLVYTGKIHLDVLKAELRAQWLRFEDHRGKAPDFIDGHQHVHQLPIVSQALLAIYEEKQATGFVRCTSNGYRDLFTWQAFPKAQALFLLGGAGFRKRGASIPMNTTFAGFYPFNHSKRYRDYFRGFLAQSRTQGLIMCHPGLKTKDEQDPLCSSRPDEYDYLMSESYLQDLREFGFL